MSRIGFLINLGKFNSNGFRIISGEMRKLDLDKDSMLYLNDVPQLHLRIRAQCDKDRPTYFYSWEYEWRADFGDVCDIDHLECGLKCLRSIHKKITKWQEETGNPADVANWIFRVLKAANILYVRFVDDGETYTLNQAETRIRAYINNQ